MRRLRSLVAATILLIGTYYIFVQHGPEFQIDYHPWSSHGRPDSGYNGSRTSAKTPSPSDDSWSTPPIDVEANPRPEFPPENALPAEIPLAESLNLPTQENAPSLPPPDIPQADSNGVTSPFEAEYPFQNDLALDLPVDILKQNTFQKPHNYFPGGLKQSAYATFMATRNPSIKDPYYLAIHSLIYRVLYSQRSHTEKYPFIVYVASHVTQEQRFLLGGAGAVVRELESVEWPGGMGGEGFQERWKDLFAKVNMWKETEFEKILFLDADAFPVSNMDPMFDLATPQACREDRLTPDDHLLDGTKVCEDYVFAGVPQSAFDAEHPNINVGSIVFSPSLHMHARLMQNYHKTLNYDIHMAEQAFLNWQFNPLGAFPPTVLEREWGGFFPTDEEEGKLKVVHEKLWHEQRVWLKKEWETTWVEMCEFYGGEQFITLRKGDGVVEIDL